MTLKEKLQEITKNTESYDLFADLTEKEKMCSRLSVLAEYYDLEVAPVVRCKHCEHWAGNDEDIYASCDRDALVRHMNFFCAEGLEKQ